MENNNYFPLIAYAIYIPLTLTLTLFVARNLFKNGLVFMRDIFHQREDIALSTNRLFEIGFYLLNFGFALWTINMRYVDNQQELVEQLSEKVGAFSIYLGFVLFFNLFLFFRGKKAAKTQIIS
jgi:hypothetical protein